MKNLRKLLLALLTALLLCAAVCAADYTDVPDAHWAHDQIDYLKNEINGYPDGTFRPENTVTRAEFISLFARIAFPEALKQESGDTWWKAAYNVCEANNLLSGTSGHNEAMPRGEIADMLGSFCRGWDGVNERADVGEQYRINWSEQRMEMRQWQPMFSDTEDFETNNDALRVCTNQGLLTGYPDGSFKPQKGVTRAEATAILTRLKAQLALREDNCEYVCTVGSNWLVTKTEKTEAGLYLVQPLTGEKTALGFSFKVKTDNLAGWKLLSGSDGVYVWGEAGLYKREGDRLRAIYPDPVLDFVQSGDRYYILTHPENEYPTYCSAAMYYPCATQVVSVDWDWNTTLLAERDANNFMQNLTDIYVENGKIYVAGSYCMGMMDVHAALYEVKDGKLAVLFGEY